MLFLKYWYNESMLPNFIKTILVGNKEGVSGSCIDGFNVGINSYINDQRKKIAAELLKLMTSKEVQKKLLMNKQSLTALDELYEDVEVCEVINCDLIKKIQPIERPATLVSDYDSYSFHFRMYLEEFLYGDETASKTLNRINDITRIYYISKDPHKISLWMSNHKILFITSYYFLNTVLMILLYIISPYTLRQKLTSEEKCYIGYDINYS
eukprot:jgi/Orpsp1_1/1191301/evm.model.d7180000084792.1